MKGALLIARREFLAGLQSKRLFAVGALLLATMVLGTMVGPGIEYAQFQEHTNPQDPDYEQERAAFRPDTVFATYLALPLLGGLAIIQLLAIILISDAVCSEWQNRTLFLLLSKPVDRSGFVMGKFLGTLGALTAFLIPVATVVFLVLHGQFGFGLDASRIGRFFAALGVVFLGTASFTAFSVLASSLTRSATLSMLTAFAAWLLVFPMVGLVGFFVALADEDFVQEGEFDRDAALDDCGEDPRRVARNGDGRANVTYEDVEAWESCWAKWEKKVDDWYTARGLEHFDFEAEREACSTEGNSTEVLACQRGVEEQQRHHRREQERILNEKWDSPRVDWSRYLSPSWTMGLAPKVLNETSFNPMAEVFGGDGTPSSRWGSIVAMLGQTGIFLGASVWIVRKRDFH